MMQDFQVLEAAASHIETVGWHKLDFEKTPDGPACLVGSIIISLRQGGGYLDPRYRIGYRLDDNMAEELHQILKKQPVYRLTLFLNRNEIPNRARRIQDAVQNWNDAPWRRKEEVIAVLREAAKNAKYKYLESRVPALEMEISFLQDSIKELTDKLNKSEKEVSRLQRLLNYGNTREQDEAALQELSDELDARWSELNALTT